MEHEKRMTSFPYRNCSDHCDTQSDLESTAPWVTGQISQNDEAGRVRREFMANMSHEIRTPLHGAVGMVELLKGTELRSEQEEYVGNALACLSRLNCLLTDILDYSAAETGKLALSDEIFDVFSVQEDLREVFALNAADKDIKIECVFDPALPNRIRGDGLRLRQILANLVGNAAKFTEKGWVRVTARPVARGGVDRLYIAFTVDDSGPGIATEIRKTIFEPLMPGDGSFVRRHQGAGVGLAIVRSLVDLMGGDISVQSAPGQGTVVSFFLPFKLPEVRFENVRESRCPSCAQLRILVVEDDKITAMYLVRLLEKIGYKTVVAADGAQALSRLSRLRFDLVLMDVRMPVVNGLQAARLIRSWNGPLSNIPIIATTSCVMAGDKERFFAAGMDAYLPKPFGIDKLRETIECLVASKVVAQSGASEQSSIRRLA